MTAIDRTPLIVSDTARVAREGHHGYHITIHDNAHLADGRSCWPTDVVSEMWCGRLVPRPLNPADVLADELARLAL